MRYLKTYEIISKRRFVSGDIILVNYAGEEDIMIINYKDDKYWICSYLFKDDKNYNNENSWHIEDYEIKRKLEPEEVEEYRMEYQTNKYNL